MQNEKLYYKAFNDSRYHGLKLVAPFVLRHAESTTVGN